MKELVFLTLIYLLSISIAENHAEKCPKNAEFNTCASPCTKTCENLHLNFACAAVCVSKCSCKRGYVQNDKECIPPEQCDPKDIKCPEGQSYGSSKFGPKTCDNLKDPVEVYEDDKGGCYCPENLVYDDYSQTCIEREKCQTSKDNFLCRFEDYNSEYVECQSSSCVKTCDAPNRTCVTDDCLRGCFCKEGFVRNTANKACVKLDECPKRN